VELTIRLKDDSMIKLPESDTREVSYNEIIFTKNFDGKDFNITCRYLRTGITGNLIYIEMSREEILN